MNDLSTFVPDVHFEQIPIKNLVSNQEYQRNLSLRHVSRTVASFDLYQINPVKVSRRDGQNYVFNGQHTIEIIAAVSGSRETPVWCMVYDDLDYTHEADIFANQQRYVKPLSSYEIFIANLEADSDTQIVIKSLVESCGLSIVSTRTLCGICAVSSLELILYRYGFHVLERTLKLIVASWEGDMTSLSANMLKGVALFLATFEESIRDDMFIDRIGLVSAREIVRTAKDRRAGSLGYAETILLTYNKKTKAGLDLTKLHKQARRERKQDKATARQPNDAEDILMLKDQA